MISTCLFIMISLSAVSASESVENQTFSSNNDAINVLGISSNNIISTSMEDVENESDLLANSLSNDNDVLSEGDGGSFSDLNTLINGDTTKIEITLQGDYVFDSDKDNVYSGGILINRPLTINGGGHFIDASNQARIFKITGSVQLINIIFKNANFTGGSGGAILIDGASNCIVDDCTFINNTAAINGGAIFLDNRASDATIRNSKFYNNTVNSGNGGALDWSAGATNGNVIDSVFENNTAGRSGGAIHWSGHYGTISNTNFTGNKATGDVISDIGGFIGGGDGGAVIWVGSHGIIKDNCNFIDNFAKNRGGAIFLHGNATENCTNTTVTHVNFEDNIAGLNGGAIDWQHGATNGTLSYSNFTNNIAWRSGGAVYWNGIEGEITYCIFDDNHAIGNVSGSDFDVAHYSTGGGNGGAVIWTGSNGTVRNSNFTKNTAKTNGGAVYLQSGTYGACENTTFDACIFSENEAGNNGGAVDWFRGAENGLVINSIFEDNVANRSGGAIHWSGHHGTISNSNFTGNNATGIVVSDIGGFIGGGDGGAVVWVGSHGIIKDNCNFIDNFAQYRGGAIFMHGNSTENCTNITVDHCNFDDNYAGLNGGAVDWNSGSHEGNIFYSTFTNNIANSNGGAVYWSGHNGEILHSNFTNNTAKGKIADSHGNIGDGGAIIWTGLNGTVINCSFIDNNASMRGGAVYLQNCSHGNCTNTTFSYVYFKNNTAGTNGGAIDWHEGAEDGHLLYAVFEQNTAKRSGGAIYWNGKNGEIKHSNFTGNKAIGINNATDAFGKITYGGDGGAVIWIGSEGEVDNCTFVDNEAAKRGGAVYLQANGRENCSNTNFTNSEFISNVAGTNGGAIDWNKGAHNGLVENVTFINNTAKRSGGAVYWNGEYGDIIHA
ncbi:MAG: hypothetical protein J6B73_08335, partial [Methanobrevibacter sp.]|nr:hypothetical protein [Methanobrevibacter sp.]